MYHTMGSSILNSGTKKKQIDKNNTQFEHLRVPFQSIIAYSYYRYLMPSIMIYIKLITRDFNDVYFN